MFLSAECNNQLIKLKKYLHLGSHLNEEKEIDYILCQYDSKNVRIKQQFLKKIISVCDSRAYGDLYIPNVAHVEWIDFLSGIGNMFKAHLAKLQEQMESLPIAEITYNGKKYDVFQDVIQWVLTENVLIFLLKDGGEYFEDNIAAFDYKGDYLWSTRDTIDVKNRAGAVFVSLRQVKTNSVNANAWVGVNYELDIYTGKVLECIIVK